MIYEVREDVTFARRRRSSSSALERNHLSAEIRIPRCDSPFPRDRISRERSFVLSFFSSSSLSSARLARKVGPTTIRSRRGRVFAESELDSPYGESIQRLVSARTLPRRERILVFSRTRRYHCARFRQRASTSRNYRRLSRFFPAPGFLTAPAKAKAEERHGGRERERERNRNGDGISGARQRRQFSH